MLWNNENYLHNFRFSVVEPNKPAWKKIRDTFGEEVFNEDGELDREALGKLIFDDIEKRKLLNQITHPEIHKRMYKEIFRLLFAGHNFIVLDLPLLFETEVMLEFIHKVITVTWYVIAHIIPIF